MKNFIKKLDNAFRGPFLFWTATMVSNVFHWLYNLIAGRTLSHDEFAILTVYMSIFAIISVPAGSLTTTVARFTAYYSEKGEMQKYFNFFRQYWWLSWVVGIVMMAVFVSLIGPISNFFGIGAHFLTFIFSLVLIPLFLFSFEKGAMLGQMAFPWIGLVVIIESIVKFSFLLLSSNLPFSPLTMAVTSLPLSLLIAWFFSVLISRSIYPVPSKSISQKSKDILDSYRFLSNSFFATLGIVLIYSLDVLLVKHFFSSTDAGIYATLSLLGKVLYFGAGSVIGILIPIATRSFAKDRNNRKPFFVTLGLVGAAGFTVLLSYILIPETVVKLLLTEKAFVVFPYLTQYSLAILFLVLSTCISSFNIARKNFLPSRLMIIFAFIQGILITLMHNSLSQVVNIVLGTSFGLFASLIILEFINFKSIKSNILNLLDLFSSEQDIQSKTKKRVLIFNWRDIKHIHAGGAEVYIHNIGKNLVKSGYDVTIFTSNDQRSKTQEKINGIQIIRRGGFVTVYIWAFLYYIFKSRNKFDVIIDSENGIPFFSPLYSRKPVVLLMHHVHQDVFFKSLIPPFSWIANFLETFFMPRVYKNSHIVAVSESTAEELSQSIGIKVSSIISNGVNTVSFKKGKKSKTPLISYVGRIKKYKSIHILINSFDKLVKEIPDARLVIAGEGDFKKVLEEQVQDLKLTKSVTFLGKVSEKAKINLLSKSWVMVHPSYQEGWGITCLEANACHTPVIASRVSGLKDSVKEGLSGYLFEYGNSEELYTRLKEMIQNKQLRERISKTAREWSEQFSWIKQAKEFECVLNDLIRESQKSHIYKWNPIFLTSKLFNLTER